MYLPNKLLYTSGIILALGLGSAGTVLIPKLTKIEPTPPPAVAIKISPTVSFTDVSQIPKRVSEILEITTDEIPNVTSIGQSDALRAGQPFFQNSKPDDYVLFYLQAKRAVLFRPSSGKIIDIAPIILNENQLPIQIAGTSTESAAILP
jgi:hypothetical protein